jgi:ethanolamine utilization protein EutA (predicted chaperonin)
VHSSSYQLAQSTLEMAGTPSVSKELAPEIVSRRLLWQSFLFPTPS